MREWSAPALWVLGALLLAVAGIGCLASRASAPSLIGGGARVLFIGNSYTYVNDVPGLVQALVDSSHAGDSIAVETVAFPDFALVDHWNEGTALREIRKGGWRWVVLQQGPSSVGANRDTLRMWTKEFASEIVRSGASPALFSAWPSMSRTADFDRAIESYSLAAVDVNGLLLPVAASWLAAWRRDPSLQLYASDGLHASAEGSYLAALAIYGALRQRSPVGLPNVVVTRTGEVLRVESARARLLQESAAEALGR
jgi:hypothetical protein